MNNTTEQPIEGEIQELPIPTTDLELIPTIYQEPDELPLNDEGVSRQKKRKSIVSLVLVGVFSLLLGTLGMLVVYPLFFERTTITLYANKETIQQNATLADIPVRTLAPVQQIARTTVQTTGIVSSPPTQAQGTLVLYNSALVAQTIYAGSALYVGTIEVITDTDVTVPAGTLAINGRAEVAAHTTSAGAAMNIAADSIYGPCCKENIKAENSAFYGGSDAVSYHTPTQTDITGAANLLKNGLDTHVQNSVLAQVKLNETLLPTHCTLSTTSDVAPGQAATSVVVTETENCRSQTYTTSEVQTQAKHLLDAKAGSMYQAEGDMQTTITGIEEASNHSLTMSIALSGLYDYSISPSDTERLKQSLSGMQRQDAYVYLLSNMHGVTKVQIQGESILSSLFPRLDTLPPSSRIDILTQ